MSLLEKEIGIAESQGQLVDVVTDGKAKAIAFDLEILADELKYSSWISALSTAGVGLIIVNSDKFFAKPLMPRKWIFWMLVVSAALLFGSLIMGAVLHWTANRRFSIKRQMMTLVLKQRILALCSEKFEGISFDLAKKVMALGYLSTDDKNKYDKLDKEDDELQTKKMLIVQQVLTLGGYLLAFACALRNIA